MRFAVPSKAKPLSEVNLRAYEAKRDLAAELLESVQQMKSGKTQLVHSPDTQARAHPFSAPPPSLSRE